MNGLILIFLLAIVSIAALLTAFALTIENKELQKALIDYIKSKTKKGKE